MIDGILEAVMMVCFAAAWPLSIARSYRARTSLGTSISFMMILEFGYIAGILNKVIHNDITYVMLFYIFNFALIAVGIAVYIRNRRLDAMRKIRPERLVP